MTTAYFLTGSYNDQDNDFELTISIPDNESPETGRQYVLELSDISSQYKLIWQTANTALLTALNAMDEFTTENNIMLYSKILTSPVRDPAVDKELEAFILNRLHY
jgi:hypothetical protein